MSMSFSVNSDLNQCYDQENLTIYKLTDLDEKRKNDALKCVEEINRHTSTVQGCTWEDCTSWIISDATSKKGNTILFVAKYVNTFVGYALFQKTKTATPYCAFIAIHKEFCGKGIGSLLEESIFREPHVKAFTGDCLKDNIASRKAFEGFAKRGYCVSTEEQEKKYLFTIIKK